MADKMLNGRLREFVQESRRNGKPWREIASEMRILGADVSHETLRSWFPESEEASDQRVGAA